jgi:hypothetical protein
MLDEMVGKIHFQYLDSHEYGFKDCFIMSGEENCTLYDYVFLLGHRPDYGNELLKRRRASR